MSETATRVAHWNDVYRSKGDAEVSWYEEVPVLSLELIAAHTSPSAAVIDIGGGASRLPDTLIAHGHTDVTVLDISAAALARAEARVEAAGGKAEWIVADVTRWEPERVYDLWHDRAAFHFLTDPADQAAYADVLATALVPAAPRSSPPSRPMGRRSALACRWPAMTGRASPPSSAPASSCSASYATSTTPLGTACSASSSAYSAACEQ